MNYLRYTSFLFVIVLLFSCGTKRATKKSNSINQLAELKPMMIGSFDSSQQAAEDSTYYDISLHMYPIWENRDGHYLYVEQAVTANPDKPYRQRIYKLEAVNDQLIESKVFTMENPEQFIGKWKDTSFFDGFDESILKEREGCGVFLMKLDGDYTGSTREQDCGSTLRGASYATSKVRISKDRIVSWDQGFNEKDEQVWGATKAGYIFMKK
ncbi:MAG: chromophore lyase CpcT/CpeT [Saprospiraceae bacterium]